MQYIRSHWQGKQSLAWSFWVNLVGLRILITYLEGFTHPPFTEQSTASAIATILFFIVIGFIFLGYQIRQDRRFGSPRRQIAELDAAYRAGEVEEGIYREQLEDLLPKL